MATITGADITARQLRVEGVEAAFGLAGNPMSYVFNRMVAEGIAPYLFRHEAGATLAATAYGFASRKLGVAAAASGPAMVNAVPSLYTAWVQGWPLLLIAGNGQSDRRGLGDFQEAPQVEAARPFTKWSVSIESPERIPYYINAAFRTALNGRPGPVFLDFPADILTAQVEESEVEMFPAAAPPVRAYGDPNLIDEALEEIRRAERPLLIIGNGAAWSDCGEETRRLVDRLQIPFVPSPRGKGVVPDDHPLNASAARSYVLRNADLIVLLGQRLNWTFHFGRPPRFAPDVKMIQIDIEPEEIGNSVAATVGILGDAKVVVEEMLDRAEEAPLAVDAWRDALEGEKQKNAEMVAPMIASDAAPLEMFRMFSEISKVVGDEATIVIDGEQTAAVSRQMLPNSLPRHRLDPGTAGGMGVGVPMAFGAQIARPGEPVICVTGDLAFGWYCVEVETAARYNLPIVFVIANNGTQAISGGKNRYMPHGYLSAPRWESGKPLPLRFQTYGEEALDESIPYVPIAYEKVAEGFGARGEVVSSPAELGPALERALSSGQTTVLNVMVSLFAGRKQQAFSWLPRMEGSDAD